jgi:hypothetical protein
MYSDPACKPEVEPVLEPEFTQGCGYCGRGGTGVHFRSSPKVNLNYQPQVPFADPLRLVVILGGCQLGNWCASH